MTQRVAVLMTLMVLSRSALCDDSLDSTVRLVKEAEARYGCFDGTVAWQYRHVGVQPIDQGGSHAIREYDKKVRIMVQGEKFRTELDCDTTTALTTHKQRRIRAFDGSTTRATDGAVANTQDGAQREDNLLRPHTTVFADRAMAAPLSAYLSGAEEFRRFPGQDFPKNRTLKIIDGGTDVVGRSTCRKITVIHMNSESGNETLRRVLWLASDHDYIPIRIEEFDSTISPDKPLLVSTVSAFERCATGLSYPAVTDIVAYTSWVLRTSGEQKVQWTMQIKWVSLEVKERFDDKVFSDVDYSTALIEYKLDSDGNVVGSNVLKKQVKK